MWRRPDETDMINKTWPKRKQLETDFHEACHAMTEAGSCQHSEGWLDGGQPLPVSSSPQTMQSYQVTDLTRYRTAPKIVRCFLLEWVQWLCALVLSYDNSLGRFLPAEHCNELNHRIIEYLELEGNLLVCNNTSRACHDSKQCHAAIYATIEEANINCRYYVWDAVSSDIRV